jgi:AcrR family transcriptional regulator
MESETSRTLPGQFADGTAKHLTKLLPIIKHRGLSHLRIEELTHAMDISKATFYKYFDSKEAVIAGLVEIINDYFTQANALIDDEAQPHVKRFQQAFQHSLLIASYLSEAFLLDLKQAYPALWERIRQAQQNRQRSLQRLYEGGMGIGIFQPLNAALVVLRDETVLRTLVDPLFLIEHDLTVGSALQDCYQAHKYQWLTQAARDVIDDTPVRVYIETMASKISLSVAR